MPLNFEINSSLLKLSLKPTIFKTNLRELSTEIDILPFAITCMKMSYNGSSKAIGPCVPHSRSIWCTLLIKKTLHGNGELPPVGISISFLAIGMLGTESVLRPAVKRSAAFPFTTRSASCVSSTINCEVALKSSTGNFHTSASWGPSNLITSAIAIINSPIHMICLSFIFCLLIGVQILSKPL